MSKLLLWILIGIGVIGLVVGFTFYSSIHAVSKKPAVYLYPEQDSQIQVVVDVNGKIIEDIPAYNSGWDVFVTKEGIIENQYDYLFYEAELNKISTPDEGWIVEYNNLEQWFEVNLALMGLNEKEIFQFKEYWLEELEYSPYYEVKLLSEEFLDQNMDLIVYPKPDTEIRLNFVFKAVDEKYNIVNPEIITPTRDGFVLVEWGGIIA